MNTHRFPSCHSQKRCQCKTSPFFLPEAHTDFIFSIIAEEAGFIGVFIVILFFVIFLISGLAIAVKCRDDFGRNLSFGITSLITLQALLNICVVTGLLPTKGIPLPFISYGGSSLIISMFMAGILLNIAGTLTEPEDYDQQKNNT